MADAQDEELRTDLWNITHAMFIQGVLERGGNLRYLSGIWTGLMKRDIDDFPVQTWRFGSDLKSWIKDAEWHLVYDLLEDLVRIAGAQAHVDYSRVYNKDLRGFGVHL